METKIFKAYESIKGKFVVFGSDGLREYPADRCKNITDAKLLYIHDAIKNNQIFTKDEYISLERGINFILESLENERRRVKSFDSMKTISDIMAIYQNIKEKIERWKLSGV